MTEFSKIVLIFSAESIIFDDIMFFVRAILHVACISFQELLFKWLTQHLATEI